MNQPSQQLLSQNITNPLLDPAIQTSGGGISFFQGFLPALVNLGFIIGSVVFFFMLLSGGIQWMTSGGDKIAVENARKRLTNALIGLLILFFIFAFVNLLEVFLGVNIMVINLEPLGI